MQRDDINDARYDVSIIGPPRIQDKVERMREG